MSTKVDKFVTKAMQRGFTLVEMMITILVAAILLVVAVPSFKPLMQRSQQTNVINDVAAMLGRARSEAVTRNRDVVVCVSADQAFCNEGAATWETGWVMFVDDNRNDIRDAAETLLQVGAALPRGVTVRTSGFPVDHVTISRGTGLLTQAGTYRYCDERGVAGLRAINISIAGQARIGSDHNENGTVEDYNDVELTTCP
jgi:type IV fimbrial biogenesis protein FimT